jgi:2'-5' RNA ligase
MAGSSPPLVLTLEMDDRSFALFDWLRREHYPPERNRVPAHLTLFHALPGDRLSEIRALLRDATARRRPMLLRAMGVTPLGQGVAFALEAPALHALREELAREWRPWLTPQDAAGFRPHVTVQNKAGAQAAAALLNDLRRDFRPFDVKGAGLLLWRYLGGPWERVARFPFAGRA